MTTPNSTDPRTYSDAQLARWREQLATHYGVNTREVKFAHDGFYIYQIDPTKPFRTIVSFENAMRIVTGVSDETTARDKNRRQRTKRFNPHRQSRMVVRRIRARQSVHKQAVCAIARGRVR